MTVLGWLIGGIVIFAIVSFFVDSTVLLVIGFVAFLIALFAFGKDTNSQEIHQKKSEPLSDTGSTSDNNDVAVANDEDNFPEPDLSYPGMVPDPHTCLSFVAKYENLAYRARECGREELAEQYEAVAAHWHYLYEEAEDEEMEW